MNNGIKTSRKHKRKSQGKLTKNFCQIPYAVLDNPDFLSLSWAAQSLLFQALRFYNGFNNGDISLEFKKMNKRKWSKSTLDGARHELVQKGWLIETRKGSRRICTLFAIGWIPIDEDKDNKFDAGISAYQLKNLK